MIKSRIKIYEGARNIELVVDTASDLSNASVLEIHVLKPNGEEAIWPAAKHSDYGCLSYMIQSGDLIIPGFYKIQAYIDGNLGETDCFQVYEKYS
jgi:hypothetical protein